MEFPLAIAIVTAHNQNELKERYRLLTFRSACALYFAYEGQVSPALVAACVTLSFFFAALIGAVIVFRFLKSTAQVNRKEIQLGGAIAGFVVMFYMLHHFYGQEFDVSRQDFQIWTSANAQSIKALTETGVKEIGRVDANSIFQRTTVRDLQLLDKNKYLMDDEFNIAIARPSTDKWEAGRLKDYQEIGIFDIPIYNIVFSMMAGENSAPNVFGIRSRRRHEIVLDGESSVSSIPLTFNMYSEGKFSDNIFKSISKQMLPGQELPPETYTMMKDQMTSMFDRMIKSQIPIRKTLRNGVYVTLLGKDQLKISATNAMFPRENLIEAAETYFAYSGFIPQGTMQNSILDNEKGVLSFNASVTVDNALIDGHRNSVLINDIGFIIDLGAKIAALTIIYVGNDPIEEFKSLEVASSSLQLATW